MPSGQELDLAYATVPGACKGLKVNSWHLKLINYSSWCHRFTIYCILFFVTFYASNRMQKSFSWEFL